MMNMTLAEAVRPSAKKYQLAYNITLTFAGSLLIAASAQLASFDWPVPITGQTFAILMLGALYGPKLGAATVGLYLFEGAMGLPFFAHGKAGFAAFAGPTGGFLVGFVFAAWLVGYLAKRGFDRTIFGTIVAMIAGNIVIYAFGLSWLYCLRLEQAFGASFNSYVLAFVPGDIIKIFLAAAALPACWKLLDKFKLEK